MAKVGADEDGLSEKEKMLAGLPYSCYDPELVAGRHASLARMRDYNTSVGFSDDVAAREHFLREWLGSVGKKVTVVPPFRCDYGEYIEIGDNTYLNFDCCILDCNKVRIGRNVLVGPGVHIYPPTHPLDAVERRSTETAHPVDIGDDVWLGGRCIVLGNVRIGRGAVIGAGSLVNRDVPEYCLAVGSPAKVIRQLERK